MIKGDLYFRIEHPDQTNTINLPISDISDPSTPIWCAQPFVDVEIEIPSLSVKRIFTMLVDTGADTTLLNVRDAMAVIGKSGYRLLQQSSNTKTSYGIGGSAIDFTTDANIIFQHDNGLLEGYSFELMVAKPARKGSKKLGLQLRIPSI